ncbi:MAG: hypothetical protein RIC24_04685 [Hyphomicrobiales bacterium]|jgi:hypothetical protein
MSDPFSTSTTPTPRSLGVNYLSGSGDMMAYGGIVVAALGVLAFFVQGQMVFLFMVPIGLAVALYFYPLIEKGVVRLGADSRGLYFERLGIIPWAAIKSVRHQQKALRTLRLHILYVELRAAPETVVTDPDDVPFWKAFMAKAWKRDGNTLSVDLHALASDPVNLVDHLLAFRPDLLKEVQDVRIELG